MSSRCHRFGKRGRKRGPLHDAGSEPGHYAAIEWEGELSPVGVDEDEGLSMTSGPHGGASESGSAPSSGGRWRGRGRGRGRGPAWSEPDPDQGDEWWDGAPSSSAGRGHVR